MMKLQFAFKCVMLIDDSDIDIWVAEQLIRKTCFAETTVVFKTAAGALVHLKNSNDKQGEVILPELIFLDLTMPVLDGFDFLDKYEELELPEIMLCILSASILTADKDRARHYKSVKGYILKPLTESLLLELKNIKP